MKTRFIKSILALVILFLAVVVIIAFLGPQIIPRCKYTARTPTMGRPHASGGDVSASQAEEDAEYAVVRTFYGTDRATENPSSINDRYGGDRGTPVLGICDVSVPRGHTIGEVERPNIWKLQFSEDPEKHVMIQALQEVDASVFFSSMSSRLDENKAHRALVYIHGFRVPFSDAARRTAQMAYDLQFDGAPIFFSWPSKGHLAAYTVDEANNEWSSPHLSSFLKDVVRNSTATNIYLIAHSMGARCLVEALESLARDMPESVQVIREIILAAPDIDAEVFKEQVLPAMSAYANPITLYMSSNDKALAASKAVHGSPRAGDTSREIPVGSKIEPIDASNVDTSFLGHSYYADERTLLADIHGLIMLHNRPNLRFGLVAMDASSGRCWKFKR